MNRYLVGFLVCFAVFLTACSESDSSLEKTSKNAVKAAEEEEIEIVEEPKMITATLGETFIAEDFAEMTIKQNNFTATVEPPNPAGYFTYYENKEAGQIYLDTVISIKSLLTSQQTADQFLTVEIIYDNKYEYITFSTIEKDGGSDLDFPSITQVVPLQTADIHYVALLPEEAETDGKPLKAIITVNGEKYEQVIR